MFRRVKAIISFMKENGFILVMKEFNYNKFQWNNHLFVKITNNQIENEW